MHADSSVSITTGRVDCMSKTAVIPVVIFIMVLSLLTGCGPADSGNEKPALSKTVQANETFQLPENAVVLQSLERDLYGEYLA